MIIFFSLNQGLSDVSKISAAEKNTLSFTDYQKWLQFNIWYGDSSFKLVNVFGLQKIYF